MDVVPKPFGCIEKLAIIMSFGIVAVVLGLFRRQLPRRLTDEGMVMRNGRLIPWSDFERIAITEIHYGGAFLGTQYMLHHRQGKVNLMTSKILQPDAVVAYIMERLPKSIQPA